MSLANLTSPTAVKCALNECDQLGREEFLNLYGFGRARDFPLIYHRQEYDSKAIAGVAHGYQFPEVGTLDSVIFSGGKASGGAARKLFELGFNIESEFFKRRPSDWTLKQCEDAADVYFECLAKKLEGIKFNRQAALNRVAEMTGRTPKSAERKFMNIDSILMTAGLPRLNKAKSTIIFRECFPSLCLIP